MTSYELQVWLWLFLESNIMKKCPEKGSWNLSNLLRSFTCLVNRLIVVLFSHSLHLFATRNTHLFAPSIHLFTLSTSLFIRLFICSTCLSTHGIYLSTCTTRLAIPLSARTVHSTICWSFYN